MTTSSLAVNDGAGARQQLAVEVSQTGILSPHSVPEIAGLPVAAGNPMPVTDAAAETSLAATATALGTPADAAWGGTGSSSVVAALKAIWSALTGTLTTRAATATPAAGTASVIATGGTAVVAITGPVRGGYITNPETALDQGIAAVEQLYIDPVASPGATAGDGNGTASSLDPGQSWSLPCAIPAGVTVRVNAASAGHKFSVVVWS